MKIGMICIGDYIGGLLLAWVGSRSSYGVGSFYDVVDYCGRLPT